MIKCRCLLGGGETQARQKKKMVKEIETCWGEEPEIRDGDLKTRQWEMKGRADQHRGAERWGYRGFLSAPCYCTPQKNGTVINQPRLTVDCRRLLTSRLFSLTCTVRKYKHCSSSVSVCWCSVSDKWDRDWRGFSTGSLSFWKWLQT